ncbi:MAG: HAD-IA family hydrolase [Pseudohongiellaceae bacterium]
MLFDLDGTLVDTAPDFVKVVARLRAEHDLPPVAAELIHQTVSDGARALVKLAFAIDESHARFEALRLRLLDLYEEQLAHTEAALYPGMADLLEQLDAQRIPWGIVTNKPEKYSRLLLDRLALLDRCGALVCPDHVKERKPNPEPIFLACQLLERDTERTVYIGDHLRDVQAAKAADVIAIAAPYGYLPEDARAEEWLADFILHRPEQVTDLLNLLVFA